MNKNNKYLITGGTGSIGSYMLQTLINKGFRNLRVVARDEHSLLKLKMKHPFIEIVTGDIADSFTCVKACQDVAGVFHFAAFKHISLAEEQPYRCIKTNVIGTLNLLEASKNITDFFIMISTDKADNPKAIYSATKYMGEKLVAEFSKTNKKIKYRVVRFGNVWNTSGSFITKWRTLIREQKDVIVTDEAATRFFIKREEAVNFIFECLKGKNAKPYLPNNLKAISMKEVLEACKSYYGPFKVKHIGLQPGENLHETIDGKTYSNQVKQYTSEEFKEKFLCQE